MFRLRPGTQPGGLPRRGRERCVGSRQFPLGLRLSLGLFITLGAPIVSGSGAEEAEEQRGFLTLTLGGKGNILWPRARGGFVRGVGPPAFRVWAWAGTRELSRPRSPSRPGLTAFSLENRLRFQSPL